MTYTRDIAWELSQSCNSSFEGNPIDLHHPMSQCLGRTQQIDIYDEVIQFRFWDAQCVVYLPTFTPKATQMQVN